MQARQILPGVVHHQQHPPVVLRHRPRPGAEDGLLPKWWVQEAGFRARSLKLEAWGLRVYDLVSDQEFRVEVLEFWVWA